MSITEAIVSGIVQGVTEFIPVSSSGHLVLVHSLFGVKEPGMFFDILLHAATLAAVLLYFRKDILDIFTAGKLRYLWYLAVASVPAVAAALLARDRVEAFFGYPEKVTMMMLVTGLFLAAAHLFLKKRQTPGRKMDLPRSFMAGVAQALALLPGVSRSGVTISTALMCGVDEEEAFRFSFLMSVPVIAGALFFESFTGAGELTLRGNMLNYSMGALAAFVFGLISLHFLFRMVLRHKLLGFAIYCFAVGVVGTFFVGH